MQTWTVDQSKERTEPMTVSTGQRCVRVKKRRLALIGSVVPESTDDRECRRLTDPLVRRNWQEKIIDYSEYDDHA